MTNDYGANASEVSLLYLDLDDSPTPGGDRVFLKGFKQIIDVLSKGINVLFNNAVSKVDYSGD